MAKGSSIQLAKSFAPNLQRLAQGMQQAATAGMAKVMAQAEEDAQATYRWRDQGAYTDVDRGGHIWDWEVSGLTAASITGYVVSPYGGDGKQLKSLPDVVTQVYRDGVPFAPKTHSVDPALTGDYAAVDGRVLGVLTMYSAYAPYLQRAETQGTVWGTPDAGMPITLEVLSVNWDAYYVPRILRPHIERELSRLAARLK